VYQEIADEHSVERSTLSRHHRGVTRTMQEYRARARDARSRGMREYHFNSHTAIEAAQQRINNIITIFLGEIL
jgi:hypothetical protein